jgi:hypothetical protein
MLREAGWVCSLPKRRGKSLCCSTLMVWSREKITKPVHQCVMHLLELLIAERTREVDAENLRAD